MLALHHRRVYACRDNGKFAPGACFLVVHGQKWFRILVVKTEAYASQARTLGSACHLEIGASQFSEVHIAIQENVTRGGVFEYSGSLVVVCGSALAHYSLIKRHGGRLASAHHIQMEVEFL